MGNMNLSREQRYAILQRAAYELMSQYPFVCTIQQGCLIVQLNWKDNTYFNMQGLTREACSYRHIVKIKPDGKFVTVDVFVNDYTAVGMGGLRISRSAFAGKQIRFTKEIALGRNNQTGQVGVITNEFSTKWIQEPVKNYFLNLGLQYQFYSLVDNFHALPADMRFILGCMFIPGGLIATGGLIYVCHEELIEGAAKGLVMGVGLISSVAIVALGICLLVTGFKDYNATDDWLD